MHLHESMRVDGTAVTIGKRVTKDRAGQTVIADRYTAVFREVDGRWVSRALKTTNRQVAVRRAVEIQARLDDGRTEDRPTHIDLTELIARYYESCVNKGLSASSLRSYREHLRGLQEFANSKRIVRAASFTESNFYEYRAWLLTRRHRRNRSYSPKTMYTAQICVKQLLKWGWRQKYLPIYELANAHVPKARAAPQPCFTTDQTERLIAELEGKYATAVAILAYSGMRVGELVQLEWPDVRLDRGDLGMFHIRRGGSRGMTKDRNERFVPIHPRIRPLLEKLPRRGKRVLPKLVDRLLLAALKSACKRCGLGAAFKTHSLRHHFASMCANHSVAYKKALTWLGHSSSEILDLYYHLSDAESEAAMRALAHDHTWSSDRNIQVGDRASQHRKCCLRQDLTTPGQPKRRGWDSNPR